MSGLAAALVHPFNWHYVVVCMHVLSSLRRPPSAHPRSPGLLLLATEHGTINAVLFGGLPLQLRLIPPDHGSTKSCISAPGMTT